MLTHLALGCECFDVNSARHERQHVVGKVAHASLVQGCAYAIASRASSKQCLGDFEPVVSRQRAADSFERRAKTMACRGEASAQQGKSREVMILFGMTELSCKVALTR